VDTSERQKEKKMVSERASEIERESDGWSMPVREKNADTEVPQSQGEIMFNGGNLSALPKIESKQETLKR